MVWEDRIKVGLKWGRFGDSLVYPPKSTLKADLVDAQVEFFKTQNALIKDLDDRGIPQRRCTAGDVQTGMMYKLGRR
jgi:hypothetical protein